MNVLVFHIKDCLEKKKLKVQKQLRTTVRSVQASSQSKICHLSKLHRKDSFFFSKTLEKKGKTNMLEAELLK